ILGVAGYPQARGDTAYGFAQRDEYLNWLSHRGHGPTRWNTLSIGRQSALLFWYRTSHNPLVPQLRLLNPTFTDPPPNHVDSHGVLLDTAGRLVEFRSVPFQLQESESSEGSVQWAPFFEAAALPPGAFQSVMPQWTPPVFGDTRAAWEWT